MTTKFNIGKAMKKAREKKGLTQGDIYRRTSYERSYISRLENNKIESPRFSTIVEIAEIGLEMPVMEFLELAIEKDLNKKRRSMTDEERGRAGLPKKPAQLRSHESQGQQPLRRYQK